jgi:hypothetical protein
VVDATVSRTHVDFQASTKRDKMILLLLSCLFDYFFPYEKKKNQTLKNYAMQGLLLLFDIVLRYVLNGSMIHHCSLTTTII